MPQEETIISVSKPTPKWATWVFRTVFNLTFGAAIWIGGTGVISDKNKVEMLLAMKAIDYVIWGVARTLGVKKKEFEDEEK